MSFLVRNFKVKIGKLKIGEYFRNALGYFIQDLIEFNSWPEILRSFTIFGP
jgi:hypothetical protein